VPEFHAEPYLHLAGLSHKSALVSWGAFYFKTRSRPSTALGASAQWKPVTWSNHAHFLLVRIEGKTMTVRVIGELDDDTRADLPASASDRVWRKVGPSGGGLRDVPRYTPSGEQVSGPIVLRL
jgi:hypothetical protein